MKKQVKFICLFIFLLVSSIFPQEEYPDLRIPENYSGRPKYDAFNPDGTPKYRVQKVAIVYVDFLDGRGSNNQQPTTLADLQYVYQNGNLDAVGEIGLTTNSGSNFIVTGEGQTLYINPCKYKYSDRWNMFFSTNGSYNGSAHPDYLTHNFLGTQAYGSFSEYWTEVSNGNFAIEPAITHPNELDPIYRKGIVNNYIEVNGNKVISYITLPRKKYDPNHDLGYFPNYDDWYSDYDGVGQMWEDARNQVIALYNNQVIPFNLVAFENEGGKIIYIMAGSHKKFKGGAWLNGKSCIVRGMYNKPDDITCQIDGITNLTHEFAHSAFGWLHSSSGRNDLMCAHNSKNINCPTHPNPVYKLKEGWVTPIHLDYTQYVSLPPVENSINGNKYVGIVTIYGKPSAAPDHLLGECFVIENRKRIGFDQKLEEGNPDFKGGLLVWHYTPYSEFLNIPDCGVPDPNLRFIPAHGEYVYNEYGVGLCGNSSRYEMGDGFFAYRDTAEPNQYKNFLTARTYSAENLKTGIELRSINQMDYGDVNSNIHFNLLYTISSPPQYDYAIFNNPNLPPSTELISTSGNVYFHEANNNDYYYNLLPGARIDIAPNRKFHAKGIKASGSNEIPGYTNIVIGSVGYSNWQGSYFLKYQGWESGYFMNTYSLVDSIVLRNVHFKDIIDSKMKIEIQWEYGQTKVPIVIENVSTDNSNIYIPDCATNDIYIIDCKISNLRLNGLGISTGSIILLGNINITNSRFSFDALNTFSDSSDIIFNNSYVTSTGSTLNPSNSNDWKGLQLIEGGINFNGVKVNKARIGLYMRNLNRGYTITNKCKFRNIFGDINMDNCNNDIAPSIIHDCDFETSTASMNDYFLYVSNTHNIEISENRFTGIRYTGLGFSGCNNSLVSDNIFEGSGGIGTDYGIVSYTSNGYYKCNDISQCYYGTIFMNSQPTLYQNEIYVNGTGMYITNNSQVIMNPAYLDDQTVIMAGYNNIHHNSGNEIYIYNTINAVNGLLMEDGYNTIEDDEGIDYLIYINNDNNDPEATLCQNNYWGTINPQYRLYPTECFVYEPYLSNPPTPPTACVVTTIDEDNSSQSEQMLLMGNIMNSNLNENYSSAVTYSEQMINSTVNKHFKKFGLRSVYINKYLSGQNLPSLVAYYNNLIPQYYNDSIMLRHVRGLKIESKIINSEYLSALENVDEIIASPNNPYELLYANIDKLRILQILDSNFQGGDNPRYSNYNVNKETVDIIRRNISANLNSKYISNNKEESKTGKKVNNKSGKQIFENLYNRIQQGIINFDRSGKIDKNKIITEKIIYDLLSNNYLPDVPPISTKQKYLQKSKTNNSIPKVYSLSQNYPNPFNPNTKINYDLPKDSRVKLVIYDILGREVKTLVNDLKTAGSYTIEFNGSQLASGIYFYRIQAGDFVKVKKMLMIK